MILSFLKEGLRFYKRARRIRKKGFPQYIGNAEEICEQIIYDCFNKKNNYFMVSKSNFCEFFARDFGFCTESLINLGFEREVKDTLNYALNIYTKGFRSGIKQTINPQGKPLNIPNVYSPDAVAFIFRSLYLLKDNGLIKKYEDFLQKEILRFYMEVIDHKSKDSLIKDRHFLAMNDHAIRKRSCYDTCMVAMLSQTIERINSELHFLFENPLNNIDFKKILLSKYWNFGYFLDDLSGSKHFCSDANIFPFYSGIIDDEEFLDRINKIIRDEGFDNPYPLKYRKQKPEKESLLLTFFAPEYERTTSWLNLGMCYLKVLDKYKKTELVKEYLNKYEEMILKHQNFLEVFTSDGQPFESLFYICDDSLLWCSVWLELKKKYG